MTDPDHLVAYRGFILLRQPDGKWWAEEHESSTGAGCLGPFDNEDDASKGVDEYIDDSRCIP
jgi:hypothetical protein